MAQLVEVTDSEVLGGVVKVAGLNHFLLSVISLDSGLCPNKDFYSNNLY